MKSLVPPLLLVLLVLSLAAFAGCDDRKPGDQKPSWRDEGRAEAECDIAAGKLCLMTAGKPAGWSSKYEAMAKEKYGIVFKYVAGCVVDNELDERMEGYNEVMQREIDRRFGPGALHKLGETARVQHQQEQQAADEVKP